MLSTRSAALLALSLAAIACASPTGPDRRTGGGYFYDVVSCAGDGRTPLVCTYAPTCAGDCSGQSPRRADPATFAWSVEGTAVRHLGSGVFDAVHVGDVAIRALSNGIVVGPSTGVPVTAFPGMQPVQTGEAFGRVVSASGAPVNGAVITVRTGPAAGWSIQSGQLPPAIPGFSTFFFIRDVGGYLLQGLPGGIWDVQVSAAGYRTAVTPVETRPGQSRQLNLTLVPE